jgi:hypothetical protein
MTPEDPDELMHAEAVSFLVRANWNERVLLQKVWRVNPVGVRSRMVSFDFTEYSAGRREIVQCNVVCGWKCLACSTVFFAATREGLRHGPCCE